MNTNPVLQTKLLGFALCAAFFPMLGGCVAGPGYGGTRVQADVAFDDDYVYYPDYEVYYSRNHHRYVYRDGRNWVTRPAPTGVSTDIILASPSVHVDFHDAPERHHRDVIKRYPKHWRPAEPSNEVRQDHRDHDNRRDNDDKGDRRR